MYRLFSVFKLLSSCICISFAFGAMGAGVWADAIQDYSKQANDLIQRKDFNGAIASFNNIIRLDRRNAWAYTTRGWCYQQLGQHQQAIIDISYGLTLNPQDAQGFDNRGFSYQQMGKYDKSIEDFNHALRINPNLPSARTNLAWVYNKLGKRPPAFAPVAKDTETPKSPKPDVKSKSAAATESAPEPRMYFLAQNNDPRWNRDAPINDANCAPTCLAMACKRFNRYPRVFTQRTMVKKDAEVISASIIHSDSPQALILAVRRLMTGTQDQSKGTTQLQVASAANQLGFKTEFIRSVSDIVGALDKGSVVTAGGCPWVPGSYGPRYGGTLGDSTTSSGSRKYPRFHNGHSILVVGHQSENFTVCDPLYFDGPISVSSKELDAFLKYSNDSVKGAAISL